MRATISIALAVLVTACAAQRAPESVSAASVSAAPAASAPSPKEFADWQKFRADRWGEQHPASRNTEAEIAAIKAKTAALIAAYTPPAGGAIDRPPVIWSTSDKPVTVYDDPGSPRMAVIPAGEFTMGSPAGEPERKASEGPRHRVRIGYALAVSLFPIVYGEYAWFVAETGHRSDGACATFEDGVFKARAGRDWRDNGLAQSLRGPATCIDFNDATAYVAWLSQKTGHRYRLLSEAEYEYASRAGAATAYSWGDDPAAACAYANGLDLDAPAYKGRPAPIACHDGAALISEVNAKKVNAFGLADMAGNVDSWTQDCWSGTYRGAPADGGPNRGGDCSRRVVRGASFAGADLRAARREPAPVGTVSVQRGFRVAREL